MKKRRFTKATLLFSFCLTALWLLLGTSSTISWFKADDALVNAFYYGNLDVSFYYKSAGVYKTADGSTQIFDSEDLYEPGFTRVTYFKIANSGNVPFSFDLSVVPDMSATVLATGVMGNKIDLTDYIRFGLLLGDTEEDVMDLTADREKAVASAVNKLSNYSENGGVLQPGGEAFGAIVLYMPTDTDNAANYRGDTAPSVSLGVAVTASQVSD